MYLYLCINSLLSDTTNCNKRKQIFLLRIIMKQDRTKLNKCIKRATLSAFRHNTLSNTSIK